MANEKAPEQGSLPKGIGQPAAQALAAIGVSRLDEVTRYSAAELLAMHGVGPKAIRVLREALRQQGKSLRGEEA